MTFNNGVIFDNRYEVEGICSSKGGMGELYFVKDLKNQFNEKIVLKVCTNEDDVCLQRFCREIRLLNEFQGNSKIVQVLDSNPDYDKPYNDMPYFVMKFYQSGDLTNWIDRLNGDYSFQEIVFNKMIFCIAELHSNKTYHRDIKPQNFLIDDDESIVVSDFGLSMELDSSTRFTNTSAVWGSYGYIPPEYQNGGFKNAGASGDIFMLGKSFYNLLTNRNPAFLSKDDISPPMYSIIERCCDYDVQKRYQTLAELQQDLKAVFDVLLNRGGTIGTVNQLLLNIRNKFSKGEYDSSEVIEFVKKLSLLDDPDKIRVLNEVDIRTLIIVLSQDPIVSVLPQFIDCYAVMVEDGSYSYSYAETIANDMKILFDNNETLLDTRVKALELAIKAAHLMNRFAAMDICRAMISGVNNEKLGLLVYQIIKNNPYYFITDIEPSNCNSDAIKQALVAIQATKN